MGVSELNTPILNTKKDEENHRKKDGRKAEENASTTEAIRKNTEW